MLPDDVLGAAIRLGSVGRAPASPIIDDRADEQEMAVRIVADEHRAVVEADGIGRFAVHDGEEVVVEPADSNVDETALQTFVHGTVAALVLGQQGRFALHASTVSIDGVGVAVSGDARAGKSTTSLAMEARGHRLVTDDVSPIDVRDGGAVVVPFGRSIHVWPETASALDVDVSAATHVLPATTKLSIPLEVGAEARLVRVVVLQAIDVEGITSRRLHASSATGALLANTYRPRLAAVLWPAAHVAWAAAVATRVAVDVLTRPLDAMTVDAVVDAIEALARE